MLFLQQEFGNNNNEAMIEISKERCRQIGASKTESLEARNPRKSVAKMKRFLFLLRQAIACSCTHQRKRVVVLLLGIAILWTLVSVLELSLPIESSLTVSKESQSSASLCESPSLPRGSIHVVVATYKYKKKEKGIGFSQNNYLFDLRLTNADVFWYRRERPEIPLRNVEGPCGMRLHERLLLPNYGRDGAAFLDHVLEVYDNPPMSIIFLHGHAAIAWHTSCEAVFARTVYFYRDLVHSHDDDDNNNKNSTVRNHMMTLTSPEDGTLNFNFDKGGVRRTRRLDGATKHNDEEPSSPCTAFKQRWHDQVFSRIPLEPHFYSCCASFILPGHFIQRYPRAFYQDWQALLTNTSNPDQGRECFEFILYNLFDSDTFTKEQLKTFYNDADALIHGEVRSKNVKRDETVLQRMQTCQRTHERRRKWLDFWKKFGLVK